MYLQYPVWLVSRQPQSHLGLGFLDAKQSRVVGAGLLRAVELHAPFPCVGARAALARHEVVLGSRVRERQEVEGGA